MNKRFITLVIFFSLMSFAFVGMAFAESCVSSNPSISITPTSQTSATGSTLSYMINLKNNDNSYCNITDFRLSCDTNPSYLRCLLVSSGGVETSSMVDGNTAPGYEWSRNVKVTPVTSLGPDSYPFAITIDDGSFENTTVTKSASVTGYYNVQGPILMTTENMTVNQRYAFDVILASTSVYEWMIGAYDNYYLENKINGVGCSNSGNCTFTFQFMPLREGETVIEFNRKNKNDSSIAETKKFYINIFKSTATSCNDSDGGKNYYIQGTIISWSTKIEEKCYLFNPDGSGSPVTECLSSDSRCKIYEHWCEDSTIRAEEYACPFGCKNGACLNQAKCTNHAQCSQACDNLGINSKWMGYGYNYRSWTGTCPSDIYSCMTGQCCIGQCAYQTTGECFCLRTNTVSTYGNVCPSGQTCGSDCYCHPISSEEFNFVVKTDKYSYILGEKVRITATLSGSSSFEVSKVTTTVTDTKGLQHDVEMQSLGASTSTCKESSTGTYTCSVKSEYAFVGHYAIPSDGLTGGYKVTSTAVVGSTVKYSEVKFEVKKEYVYNDYVDVSINPKEKYTMVGKEVKYEVKLTDKHPIVKCLTESVTGKILTSNEAESIECNNVQSYEYLIDVDGLPYNTLYPNTVTVQSGSSKVFELKVFVSSVKTAEGITSISQQVNPSSTTTERSVAVTGGVVSEVAATEVVPIKEAAFKFSIKSNLKGDSTVSDSDSAVLRVKFVETSEPPAFPEQEKINIELRKGWNLISVPGKGISFVKGTCSEEQKPLAFVYFRGKYATLEESLNIMGKEEILSYLSTHSFWVYSYEDCSIGFYFKGYSTYGDLSLVQGWNLLGITKDMVGETLSSINKDCNFEKIYIWDSDSQKWKEKYENELIEKMGDGILVKVTEICGLKENLIQPPPFPEG